jgi:hypothetical protein
MDRYPDLRSKKPGITGQTMTRFYSTSYKIPLTLKFPFVRLEISFLVVQIPDSILDLEDRYPARGYPWFSSDLSKNVSIISSALSQFVSHMRRHIAYQLRKRR